LKKADWNKKEYVLNLLFHCTFAADFDLHPTLRTRLKPQEIAIAVGATPICPLEREAAIRGGTNK